MHRFAPLVRRLALSMLLIAAALASAAEPAPNRLQFTLDTLPQKDGWAGLAFGDAKVGYAHLSVQQSSPGEYEIRALSVLVLRLLGFEKTIELRTRDVVRPDLTLVRFETEYRMDGSRLDVSGMVEASRLRLTVRNAGTSQVRELPLVEAPIPASAIGILPLLRGVEAGRTYRYPVFHPESMELADVDQAVEPDSSVPGAAYAVRYRLAGQEGVLWLDARGHAVAETALGGLLRAIPEPEAEARAYADAARASDRDVIVDLSLVRADRALPLPRRIGQMSVRLEGVSLELPSSAGQDCTRAAATWECQTNSRRREKVHGDPRRWLRPSIPVPSDHAAIARLSREVVAGAASQRAQVRAILRWLDANIRKEGADSFSALDVLATRRAECQGHSYLYAALARAAGIPTRVANGLVYSEEHQGFLYHTWAESLLEGEWQAVDPTFGQETADGTHIKVLDGEEYGEVAPMMELIGRVRIRVDSFEYWR